MGLASVLSLGQAALFSDVRPLDWNGPRERLCERFRDEGLARPIIEHVERSCRRNAERIAIRDSDCALTYRELWDGI